MVSQHKLCTCLKSLHMETYASSLGVGFFSLQVQLYVYFMLKFAMEILLSESSVVTQYYFSWGTRSVALFLALLGLTVLPVNWVVGSYASNIFQDRYKLTPSPNLHSTVEN
jgi:hypothetical protein